MLSVQALKGNTCQWVKCRQNVPFFHTRNTPDAMKHADYQHILILLNRN